MSPIIKIICLAYSKDIGIDCFAGIDCSTGKWVRLILVSPKGHIDRQIHFSNEGEPSLGHILSIPVSQDIVTHGFESENRVILPGNWFFEGIVSTHYIGRFCSSTYETLHNAYPYVNYSYLLSLPFENRITLTLIEVFDFHITPFSQFEDTPHVPNATFTNKKGISYTLPLFDPVLRTKLEREYIPQIHCFLILTIVPSKRLLTKKIKGIRCWKVIVGVIETTDSKEIKPQLLKCQNNDASIFNKNGIENVDGSAKKLNKQKIDLRQRRFEFTPANMLCHLQVKAYLDKKKCKKYPGIENGCIEKEGKKHGSTDVTNIITTIQMTGQLFNAEHIINIIRGVKTNIITDYCHHTLNTYGVGIKKSTVYWNYLIDNMLCQKILTQSNTKNSALKLGLKSTISLQGIFDICVIKQKENKLDNYTNYQNIICIKSKLLNKLRILRRRIASIHNISPFSVLSDISLRKIAQKLPENIQGLLLIPGIKKSRIHRYGHLFIKKIILSTDILYHPPTIDYPFPMKRTIIIENNTKKTLPLLKKGLSIETISTYRALSSQTIYSHIEYLLQMGETFDISPYVPVTQQRIINEIMDKLNSNHFADILNALKGNGSIAEIRIVRAIRRNRRIV